MLQRSHFGSSGPEDKIGVLKNFDTVVFLCI